MKLKKKGKTKKTEDNGRGFFFLKSDISMTGFVGSLCAIPSTDFRELLGTL